MRTNRLIIALLACATITLVACGLDEKEPIETMTSGFMTATTDHKGYITTIKDDFGKTYRITEKSEVIRPDTTLRVVTSIAIADDGDARILQLVSPMSFKAPEDSIISDTLRVRDPLKVSSTYIGGGYLNIVLAIKVKKEDTNHMILYTHMDTPARTAFTIYHNAYGDSEVYTKNAYLSIPLSSYGLHKNDTVSISYNSPDGDREIKLVYNK